MARITVKELLAAHNHPASLDPSGWTPQTCALVKAAAEALLATEMERDAAIARERERCAKIVEKYGHICNSCAAMLADPEDIAAEIREAN